MKKQSNRFAHERNFKVRLTRVALATSLLAATCAAPAWGMIIDTGNEDVSMRFDTQVRYNLGVRVEKENPDFANSPSTDSSELAVKRGDLVMNRVDLLSEFDFVYKQKHGFRLSASAWNDFEFDRNVSVNPTLAAAGFGSEYTGGRFNSFVKRYVGGPSGEFLDAFAFTRFDIGDVPVNLKLGQHVVYWGEGLYSATHAINYSQAPMNFQKAAASPGIEAKEVFMPIPQLSGQAQLTDELSLGAQVMLGWKPTRLPPGGTFFGSSDATRADQVVAGPGVAFPFGADVEPSRKSGQFGVNLRWAPEWLEGTTGFYYRRFNEVLPWAMMNISPAGRPNNLHLAYAKDTEMYAMSLSKNLAGVNLGVDLSYRKNTALNSATAPGGRAALGFQGLEGARGNTWHLVANSILLLPKTAAFEGGALNAELVYSRLDKVTQNADLFKGENTALCTAGFSATQANCSTKDYWGIQFGGNLDYPQALPGVNLSVPFALSYGLKGNAANINGGNEGNASWSIGLLANYLNRHEFTLKYNDSRTRYTRTSTGAIVQNGTGAIANNHAWISFTYKTSF